MHRVFLADTDQENIKNLSCLLRKDHGILPDTWRGRHSYRIFLEDPAGGTVFIRIDNRLLPGLELTQAVTMRGANIRIVWMAESVAYAVDAFHYGAEAYLLLPATGPALFETINALKAIRKYTGGDSK